MEMYFATNEKDEVIGMSSTMIGDSKEPIDVPEEIINELMVDMSGYKIINKKLIRNNQLFLSIKKEAKKEELSQACQQCITEGFRCSIQNKEYRFSYDAEAQTNIAERWQLFQNDMITSIRITAHTETESVRIDVNKDEFNQIYLASVLHKEKCISRFRDLFVPLVDNAVLLEQVADIHWDNEVVFPIEPPVEVTNTNTLDDKIKKANQKTQEVAQSVDINGMAMMEFMSMMFSGEF